MNYLNKSAIILTLLLFSTLTLFSQEITEENYLKADKEIWDEYELKMDNLSKIFELHPDKKDSLLAVANELEANTDKKNREAAIKYAAVPSGLKRLYMLRLNIPKDTLRYVFNSLPEEMQKSEYGKSILSHIKSNQIEEGDKYYNFKATDSDGNEFTLANLKGKNVLLLYGGLSCVQEEGRDFLNTYSSTVDKQKFSVVVFYSCANLEELRQLGSEYDLDFIFISDFLGDHSPFKIRYGAQATPTCFFIDEEGTVIIKSTGLPEIELNKLKSKLI
nr:redoxin family protein [uncultured Draconibacterium sp.]